MEFLFNIDWWKSNIVTVALSAGLFIQWIAFQALVVHYSMFRKNLKQPRPDGIRLNMVEQSFKIHSEQMDRIFAKLAHLNREIDQLHTRGSKSTQVSRGESVETAHASMGELNLRKRIQELRSQN